MSNHKVVMQLSNNEEQLMNHLWELRPFYMKDLIDQYTEPKPAQTTIATVLERIEYKGYLSYKLCPRRTF